MSIGKFTVFYVIMTTFQLSRNTYRSHTDWVIQKLEFVDVTHGTQQTIITAASLVGNG